MKLTHIFYIISACVIAIFVADQNGQLKLVESTFNQNQQLLSSVKTEQKSINPGIVKAFGLNTKELEKADSKEFYQKWLQQEENAIWKNLEAVYSITKQQADELKKQWHDEYVSMVNDMIKEDRCAEKASEENIKLIHEIMRDYNLNPEDVAIIPWKKPVTGGSTDRAIFINEDYLAPMPLPVKKFVLGHEIAHVFAKDHSTSFVLAKVQQMKSIKDSDNLKKALQDFAYFKEIRADITVMLKGAHYAQGQMLYMDHQIKSAAAAGHILDDGDRTHPSSILRLAIGKRLNHVAG